MSFSVPRMTLSEILALARALGYDGFEPRAEHNHRHGIELEATPSQRKAMRRQIEESGVAVACLSTSCKYADPAVRTEQIERTHRYIDLAADVGCLLVRVFGGEVPVGMGHDAVSDGVVEAFGKLGEHAQERGVSVCMETHDSWCDAAIVAFIMREVNHPAVGVNWDMMHTLRRGRASMEEAYRILRPWIRHVHIHDGLNRLEKLKLVPLGTGEFDIRTVLRLLKCGDYGGYVSGEWMESLMDSEYFGTHLSRELVTLKRYEAETAASMAARPANF